MTDLSLTVKKLCAASVKDFSNPYLFEWPENLSKDQWFFSPDLISLYGTSYYEALDDTQKKTLSFYEAANFFSLNIHGEKALTEGLARRLYLQKNAKISPYLHHFLDEENKHMVYFGNFCGRYAGKIYSDKKMAFPRDYEAGEEDFLFFAKVMIFEEIVDVYNLRMSVDERLVPVAREINRLHHHDEVRHLVFGREIVSELFQEYRSRWRQETLDGIRQYLSEYFLSTWKEYYNPEVYRDAGIVKFFEAADEGFQAPLCCQRRKEISSGCMNFLLEKGIFKKELFYDGS